MGPAMRRADEEETREPPAMHEVWLEGGMQKDGRWYWGEKRGDVDGGWDSKMVRPLIVCSSSLESAC